MWSSESSEKPVSLGKGLPPSLALPTVVKWHKRDVGGVEPRGPMAGERTKHLQTALMWRVLFGAGAGASWEERERDAERGTERQTGVGAAAGPHFLKLY